MGNTKNPLLSLINLIYFNNKNIAIKQYNTDIESMSRQSESNKNMYMYERFFLNNINRNHASTFMYQIHESFTL